MAGAELLQPPLCSGLLRWIHRIGSHQGDLNNYASASLSKYGTLTNQTGATLSNFAGSTLSNQAGATLTNNAIINNSATVDNFGTIKGTGTYTQTAGLTTIEAGASFTQGTLQLQGGSFTDYGTALINGDATNSGGSITIDGAGANLTVTGSYTQTGGGSKTTLDGGTFDPPAIDVDGGIFGGFGTVDRSLTLTGDTTTLQAGDPIGELLIAGDYTQTGGDIVFDIESNGSGGFDESALDLGLNLTDVNIVFDFEDGADPGAFEGDGLFNIATFFKATGGASLLGDFGGGDTFTLEEADLQTALNFDPATGDLSGGGSSSTPEPGTLFLLLLAMGTLGFLVRRQGPLGQH